MKNLALSNSICAALGIKDTTSLAQPHGTVVLANDSLFSQATFQQEVTTFGIGYNDPNRNRLMDLLNFLAPRRPGPRNAIVTQFDETEPFETVDPAKVKREILADFHTVKQRTSTKVTRKLPNRGLSVVLDKDQLIEKPDWQNMHVAWLMDLLTRASILEAIALFEAFALGAPVVWDSLASPDLDIKSTNIQVLAPVTGFKANRAAYGESATLLRQLAYEAQAGAGGFARSQLMTDEQIATGIGVERMRTNLERYNNGGSKDAFLGDKVLLFTAQDKESPEDSSNVVRHVSNTDLGGGEYAVYIDDRQLKKVIITVENYELLAVQHTTGCALLTASGV
jgi:hypothetical protein